MYVEDGIKLFKQPGNNMHIMDLPLDVFITICEFSNPLDVVSFGECAKQPHAFSKTRSLWITLAQNAIKSNFLYGPAFPILQLTTRQLQQIACAPSRMIERFRNVTFEAKYNYDGGSSQPGTAHGARKYRVNKRLVNPLGTHDRCPLLFPPTSKAAGGLRVLKLPPSLTPNENGERVFEKISLIPGGRFLVATFGKEAALFDLGIADYARECEGGEPSASIPIYAHWIHHGEDFFMPSPSSDGKEVRLALGGALDPENMDMGMLSIVRIWEETSDTSLEPNDNISPLRSVRVVQHYAPLPRNHSDCVSFFTIVGDLFVYAYASEMDNSGQLVTDRIHVWNFIEDACVEWEIDEGEYKELFIDNGYVVMITFPDIVGWKIPPLRPRVRSRTNLASPSGPPTMDNHAPQILPLYPPTFRIPLITNPNPHLTCDESQSLGDYLWSELNDINYNPLNDLGTMLIGRMLDWYNVGVKVRKFDAAFARAMYYGFLSYGVEGWPVGENGDLVDKNERMKENTSIVAHGLRRDPRIVLETAMYFKGDIANGVGLVMDPFRECDGYTVKTVVASDGRVYILIHDQSGVVEDDEDLKRDEAKLHQRSLADRLWTPRKVVTVELAIPGDDDRDERVGNRDSSEDTDEEENDDDSESEEETEPEKKHIEEAVQPTPSDSKDMEVDASASQAPNHDHGENGDEEDDGMCHCDHGKKNTSDEIEPNANEEAENTNETDNEKERLDARGDNPAPKQPERLLPSIPDDGLVRGRCDISFDPCSGRFCFIDKDRGMVGIVDYLS